MNQKILHEIESLLNSIPASEYDSFNVASKKEYDHQIGGALDGYLKTIAKDINKKVVFQASHNSGQRMFSKSTVDFVFKIGEQKTVIKIDDQIRSNSRDLLNYLMNNGYDVLWIIWSRVESRGFGKGYHDNRIIELSNFVECMSSNSSDD